MAKDATTPFTLLVSQTLLGDKHIKGHLCGCNRRALVLEAPFMKVVNGAVQSLGELVQDL